MSDLWNLMSDNGSPVIQGQAGKPFYHQKGPNIKLGDTKEQAQASQQIIDNSCLCKYPYMRYFYIYAYVDTQDEQLSFLSLDFPQQSQQQNYFPDYTVQQDRGYRWKLLQTTYQYAGCLPHTSDVGVWHTIPLFPYGQQCASDSQEDPQIPVKNLTFPAPSFIGSKDSSIQQGDEQVSTPFRKDTGPASLMRMLVCSYKCCNGYSGCGVLADDQQSDSQIVCPPGGHFCQAWFTVTWQYSPDNVLHYTSISLPYKASCGQCYLPDRTQLISCTSARILRHRQMLVIDQLVAQTCQECLQKLASDILQNQTPPQVDCKVYRLYQYPVTEQCKFGVPFIVETSQQWADVPQQIVGVGQGCQFNGSHQLQPVIVCNKQAYGVRAFQWAASDNCLQQPVPPDQLTGEDVTGLQCECTVLQDPEITDTSDSVFGDRDSYDPPCNIPDPPPYKYRNLTQGQWAYPQFRHTPFDIYKVKLISDGGTGSGQHSCGIYQTQTNEDGSTNWQLEADSIYDFEVLTGGYFNKLQNRFAREQNQYYYYSIVRHGCDPYISEQDKSPLSDSWLQGPSQNNCPVYYAVYFNPQTDCPEQSDSSSALQPHSKGCTVWDRLGPLNDSQLTALGIIKQKWTPYRFDQNNWGYRYVAAGDQSGKCQDPPGLPALVNCIYTISSWTPICDSCGNVTGKTEPDSYKPQPSDKGASGSLCASPLILQPGFYLRRSNQTSDSTVNGSYQRVENQEGYNCSISQAQAELGCELVYITFSDVFLECPGTGTQPVVVFKPGDTTPYTLSLDAQPGTEVQVQIGDQKILATVLDINLDASHWEQQFQDAQIDFHIACCAKYYYYVRIDKWAVDELDCDAYVWQYAGRMTDTEFMQNWMQPDVWLYVSDGAASYAIIWKVTQEPLTFEDMQIDYKIQNSHLRIPGAGVYLLQGWGAQCEGQGGQLSGTVPPQSWETKALAVQAVGQTVYQARAAFDGALKQGSYTEYCKWYPVLTSCIAEGQIQICSQYQNPVETGLYAFSYDTDTYTQVTKVVPEGFCQVFYVQLLSKYWCELGQTFKYLSKPVYYSGMKNESGIPILISFSGTQSQVYQDTLQIENCDTVVQFPIVVYPEKKNFQQQLQNTQLQFNQKCCDLLSYFKYTYTCASLVNKTDTHCGIQYKGWPDRDTSQCSSGWQYIGRMSKPAFYRKYIGLNCWVPFSQSADGGSGNISYFIATSDSSDFCAPAPQYYNPDFVFAHYTQTFTPDACENGTPIYTFQDCYIPLQLPDFTNGWGGASVFAIAAGCMSVPAFRECMYTNCLNKVAYPDGIFYLDQGQEQVRLGIPEEGCSATVTFVDASSFGVSVNSPFDGYFTGRFDSETGYPIFVKFHGQNTSFGQVQEKTVSVEGSSLHYILYSYPTQYRYEQLCGTTIKFHRSCLSQVQVTLFYLQYKPCAPYPARYTKGQTITPQWQTVQQTCGSQITDNVCKGGWYSIPNPTAKDDISDSISACATHYWVVPVWHCQDQQPETPTGFPDDPPVWDVCKAYTVFYITFAKGSYKCTTDVNIDDPQATTCQWSKSGPFMKYDDNGNLNYQNVPGEGFYADYNLDNLPWSSVPFDSYGRILKPQKCDSFYYVRVVQHCITQEPASPTDCPPKRDVNWDVCGCRIKVMRIGPFDDWWLNTSGHPVEWAKCPSQLGPYPFDWTVYLFHRNAKRTVGWAKSRTTYEIHDYDCTKIACPLSILTQTRDDIGVVSDYGEKYYGLYTDQFVLHHSGGQSNYVSCNVNAKNAYMQYAICYQYCQDQPTDQEMLSRIIGDLSDDSRQLHTGWISASLHPTVFCNQQAQYFCNGYRYSGSFTLSSAQLTSQSWTSQTYNYQCHPEWNMTTNMYQGSKYVMKDVCQSGNYYNQKSITICTGGEYCDAWQQGMGWYCYTAGQDDYCDCGSQYGSGQRIIPMFRYQRKNDQGQYVQCTCEEALCLQDGRLSGYLTSDMIYWRDSWQPIQYTITSGKDTSGTWAQISMSIDQFSWEKETESQTTDEYESQPGCLDTFTYYSKTYLAMQVSGSFTLRHTTPA